MEYGTTSLRTGTRLRHWLIALPVLVLPLLLGGARPWFWAPVAGIFMLGLIVLLWREPNLALLEGVSKKVALLLAFFLAVPLFQIVPLPVSWLTVLSPERMLWLNKAGDVIGGARLWTSVSYTPLETVFDDLWLLFLILFALLFRRSIRAGQDATWIFRILFVIVGIEALYGLLQVLNPSMGVLGEPPGDAAGLARGSFINRNHYASFLGMLWPLLLAYVLSMGADSRSGFVDSHSRRERRGQIFQKQVFASFIIWIALLALFFSQSRGGILCSLVSLTILVVLGGTRRRALAFFVGGCWVIMLVYGGIIGFGEILARFNMLATGDTGRIAIWTDTWRLIKDHFWVGGGLGSYPALMTVYESHVAAQKVAAHAHNDYLELAAELGPPITAVIVLAAYGTWISAARDIWLCTRRVAGGGSKSRAFEPDLERDALIRAGALAGCAAFLLQLFVEFNWQIPANQLYFVILFILMGRK